MIFEFLQEHGFEAQKLKAVLLDMDGVLFDSMRNHALAWQAAVERYGLTISEEEVYINEGRTGSGTINALALNQWGRNATEDECKQIYQTKSELFNSCPKAYPFQGMSEALNAIKNAGIKCVIVTGSGQLSLFDRLNTSYPSIFRKELMVTAFDVKYGKPDPEPYLMGLKKACVEAGEAIVVENAPLGVQSGRAAGIFTIAVNTGPLKDDILYRAGANVVYPDMQTFTRLIVQHP